METAQPPRPGLSLPLAGAFLLVLMLAGCQMSGVAQHPDATPADIAEAERLAAQSAVLTWWGSIAIIAGLTLFAATFAAAFHPALSALSRLPRTGALGIAAAGLLMIAFPSITGPVKVAGYVAVALGGVAGLLYVVNVGVNLWDARQAKRGKNRLAAHSATRVMEGEP